MSDLRPLESLLPILDTAEQAVFAGSLPVDVLNITQPTRHAIKRALAAPPPEAGLHVERLTQQMAVLRDVPHNHDDGTCTACRRDGVLAALRLPVSPADPEWPGYCDRCGKGMVSRDHECSAPPPEAGLREAVIHAARDVDGAWDVSDRDGDLILWDPEAGEVLADLRTAVEAYDALPVSPADPPTEPHPGHPTGQWACAETCEVPADPDMEERLAGDLESAWMDWAEAQPEQEFDAWAAARLIAQGWRKP